MRINTPAGIMRPEEIIEGLIDKYDGDYSRRDELRAELKKWFPTIAHGEWLEDRCDEILEGLL